MVLHLLKQDVHRIDHFTEVIRKMRHNIRFCSTCNNISDTEICSVCINPSRTNGQLCVVENLRDVIAIESTQQYNGRYHVLGGILSPLDGIGPDQLNIGNFVNRLDEEQITELIMALSPSIEGDTTVYYLSKLLAGRSIRITTIARGISFGGELEYTDEMTLAKAMAKRLPVENYVKLEERN